MVDKRVLVPLGVGTPSLPSCGSVSQALLGGRSPARDEEVPVPVVSPLEGCSSSEEVGAGLSLR